MAHAKQVHLKDFHLLVSEIRRLPQLKEKSFGCFYRRSKGVLHFHIHSSRLYAHVFDGLKWTEMDLVVPTSENDQKRIFKVIVKILNLEA